MVVPAPGADADVVESSRPGVERPFVHRHVHHVGVGPEHVLRAVPVVCVPVDDHDPLTTITEVRGRDRNVVDQAEPHCVTGLGVMTRRPYRAKRGVALAPFQRVDRGEPRPRRVDSGLPRRGVRARIGVEMPAATSAEGLELLEIRGIVHTCELGTSRGARLEFDQRAVGSVNVPILRAPRATEPDARGGAGSLRER